MNRRDFMKVLGASSIAGWAYADTEMHAKIVPLQQLADQKQIMFGSCLALKYFNQSPSYKNLFLSQCDIATPELHMKWDSLSRQPGEYDFSNADAFVAFCNSNRIKVRGHTLVWHDSLPAWVKQQISPTSAKTMMQSPGISRASCTHGT
jgi:endo-1,4-beta-xylanase